MSEPVTLTDAEREALVDAVGYHCSHVGPIVPSLPGGCRDCYEVVDDAIAGTVALIVAARMADAWDEGAYEAGYCCCDPSGNPYRPKKETQ